MRKALWENVVRSKNFTPLKFIQVQTLSLPMLHHRYACVCLCIVLVPMAWFPAFIFKSVLLLWTFLFPGWLAFSLIEFGVATICLVTLAHSLWDCITLWGYCPSHLGTPLAHLLSESNPLFLLPDPGSYCKVFWCIHCGLVCFGMQFIHKFTISVLMNKQC